MHSRFYCKEYALIRGSTKGVDNLGIVRGNSNVFVEILLCCGKLLNLSRV